MPFGTTPDEKLFSSLIYQNIIAPAFKDLQIDHQRIDTQHLFDAPLSSEIEYQLRTAHLTLVDLSGNNPNVFYELGFRKAYGKRFICMARDPDKAAFYGRQFQVIDYTSALATEQIRRALTHFLSDTRDQSEASESIDALLDDLRSKRFPNPFQARIADWRVRRTSNMVASISNSDWQLDTLSPSEYAVYIFAAIVDVLRPGEEYCTVSNSRFWAFQDINRLAFLRANVSAALKGANIKRVILVPKADLNDPSYREQTLNVLERHLAACHDVATSGRGTMSVRVRAVDDISDALVHFGHFAVARVLTGTSHLQSEDRGGLVVVPRYANWKNTDSINAVRLLFSRGSVRNDTDTRDYLEKYDAAESSAADIETFMRGDLIRER